MALRTWLMVLPVMVLAAAPVLSQDTASNDPPQTEQQRRQQRIDAYLEAKGDTEPLFDIQQAMAAMAHRGAEFPPALVLESPAGLEKLLTLVFPEYRQPLPKPLDRLELEALVQDLASGKFETRQKAYETLIHHGSKHQSHLRKMLKRDSLRPEQKRRIQSMLEHWDAAPYYLLGDSFRAAFTACMDAVAYKRDDLRVLACIEKCLIANVHKTPRKGLLAICFTPLTKARDPEIQDRLAKLASAQPSETSRAAFAVGAMSNRAGNDYVPPLHMACLQSSQADLIRAALNNLPKPCEDEANHKRVKQLLTALFGLRASTDDSAEPKSAVEELARDAEFLRELAPLASRDFQIAAARKVLVREMLTEDTKLALTACHALADEGYRDRPLPADLAEASRTIFAQQDIERRRAVARLLAVYAGPEVDQLLIQQLSDSNRRVIEEVHRSIQSQYKRSDAAKRKAWHSKLVKTVEQADQQAERNTMRSAKAAKWQLELLDRNEANRRK